MIEKIIAFSVRNKLIIGLFILALIAGGISAMTKLAVDAVPDITNNQVQVVTTSTSLAPQEVEQFITFPLEMSLANIPNVTEIRSISRFGLSVITVVFEEDIPILHARQYVKEQIDIARQEIPTEMGTPEMMPITTGLGEIYQYTLTVDSSYSEQYDIMQLRTIQDWIVKRQLAGIPGIIEVSSFGGYLKQYEVAIDPIRLRSSGVTLSQVFEALERNNQNSGGSYIEKSSNAYYIRTEGLVKSLTDIENIVVDDNNGVPVLIKQIASVGFGHPPRFGAMTMDGKGEAVGGITLMLKGANSSQAIDNVHERVKEVQRALPKGVHLVPYLDRSVLVGKAINTVTKNLIEGGLIVIFVLLLLLGNFRAGLIVASVIPLSLLFAFILMNLFGVSANLMSLGAIDFGIVVDGAVIIVEGVLHFLYSSNVGKSLTRSEMDKAIIKTSSGIIGSAAFGVLIIIVVFFPIMTLSGIEGKMFTPMAQTVVFAIMGALILSITYVPMMSALVLKRTIKPHKTIADKIVGGLRKLYRPVLIKALTYPKTIIGGAAVLFVIIILLFTRMGAEFIPTLNEGDLAMQATIEPGSSLSQMIKTTTQAEKILLKNFPEVKHVVSKIGTAEVPTDPMAVEDADVMILLKEPDEWTSANNREALVEKMKESLDSIEGAQFDFTQPIQLRFNELISGAKTDVVVQLYGDDLDTLSRYGKLIQGITEDIEGAGDVKLEQTEGLPQLMVRFNREKLAIHGINIEDANRVIRSAFAGENTGIVYEGERRFDLTVRLSKQFRKDIDLSQLYLQNVSGKLIPLSEIASVNLEEGPMQISRENAHRRISVGINVRNRDISSFIHEVEDRLNREIRLPAGYYIEYGGQFENLEAAKARLSIAVPVALALIFILLFFAFKSMKYALLIYATVPLSAVGGVIALILRDMPFSISAGVGFIALFGVAVLNGIVLISYYNQLKMSSELKIKELVFEGALTRLRPVLMTAAVASLGFLPMAISTSSGAEVQKPLATVVIGGLITATLLTLIVLPTIYYLVEKRSKSKSISTGTLLTVLLLLSSPFINAQNINIDQLIDSMKANHPLLKAHQLELELAELDKRSSFSLGSSSLNYQFGQINSDLSDRFIQFDQSIGNPIYMARNRRLTGHGAELQQIKYELIEKNLEWQVSSTWQNWIVTENKRSLIQDQLNRFDEYITRLQARERAGDVSLVDLNMTEIYRSELSHKLMELTNLSTQYSRKINDLTWTNTALIWDSSYQVERYAWQGDQVDSTENLFLKESAMQVQIAEDKFKLQRSRIAPEFSTSYFNQTLDHTRGFQGGSVGIAIPLLDRSHYLAVKKAKIEIEQSALETGYMNQEYETRKTVLTAKLRENEKLLNSFENQWIQKIQFLGESVDNELKSGEIDYYKYLQVNETILDMRLKHLDLINDYNQIYFELKYLNASNK